MGFRDDIAMVIGGLQHGLDFETAFSIVEQSQAQRQQRRQAQRPDLAGYSADIASQMMEGEEVDPARLSAYAQMVAPSYNVGPGKAGKYAESVTSSLGGTSNWDAEDDAAFMDPESPNSPYSLITGLIDDPTMQGGDGLPNRSAIRQAVAYQTGVPPEEKAGFDAAFDRTFDMIVSQSMPDKYGAYKEKVSNTVNQQPRPAEGSANWAKAAGLATGGLAAYGAVGRPAWKALTGRSLPKAGFGGRNIVGAAARAGGRVGQSALSNLISGTRFDPATQPYGQVGKIGEALSKLTRPAGTTAGEVGQLNLLRGLGNTQTSGGLSLGFSPLGMLLSDEYREDPSGTVAANLSRGMGLSEETQQGLYGEVLAPEIEDPRPWYQQGPAWEIGDYLHRRLPGI